VSGNVEASERLEIQASGIVEGDVRAPRLLIQEGAIVNGHIEMTKAPETSKRPAATPVAPTPVAAPSNS
jgi:cytoskeletal protein CcmA (bactofilin family)